MLAPPPAQNPVLADWQQFLDALVQRNVPPDARRDYKVRVRDFIEGLRDKDLSQVTLKDVQTYLECAGAKRRWGTGS